MLLRVNGVIECVFQGYCSLGDQACSNVTVALSFEMLQAGVPLPNDSRIDVKSVNVRTCVRGK